MRLNMLSKTRNKLLTVAQGLGELLPKVVFVGSSILDLYATLPGAPEIRPTRELDLIIALPAPIDYVYWEDKLKQRGFTALSRREAGPPYHWTFQDIHLHLKPLFTDGVTVENRWYEEGVFHAQKLNIAPGCDIKVFSPVYFLATKCEAFAHRGQGDFRTSEDFEDILFLLENRPEIQTEVSRAFYEVRQYLHEAFAGFLKHPALEEGLHYLVPFGHEAERIPALMQLLRQLSGQQQGMAA
jgi:hypothetical protein